MKIAVVRNRENQGIIARFGRPCPEIYGKTSVQRVIDALRELGHEVATFEGDMTMLPALNQFFKDDGLTLAHGLVFNMAYGVQGDDRYTHVPAMLEMAGVPYTGSTPLGHALALDKVITKILMRDAGVPTPEYRVFGTRMLNDLGLRYPLVVKPRHESSSFGLRRVENRAELTEAVSAIEAAYQQDALVEEYIEGREVAIVILGNTPPITLPIVELDFTGCAVAMMSHDDKMKGGVSSPQRVCPALIDPSLETRLRQLALATFRACHLRDYARVDIRIDSHGNPFVLEINSMASLGWTGSYVMAARQAGYSFPELVGSIVDAACQRYNTINSKPSLQATSVACDPTAVSD